MKIKGPQTVKFYGKTNNGTVEIYLNKLNSAYPLAKFSSSMWNHDTFKIVPGDHKLIWVFKKNGAKDLGVGRIDDLCLGDCAEVELTKYNGKLYIKGANEIYIGEEISDVPIILTINITELNTPNDVDFSIINVKLPDELSISDHKEEGFMNGSDFKQISSGEFQWIQNNKTSYNSTFIKLFYKLNHMPRNLSSDARSVKIEVEIKEIRDSLNNSIMISPSREDFLIVISKREK
jgi:hypothetical protein